MTPEDYSNPLNSRLLGNRDVRFVNGLVLSINVAGIIVNGYGEPIMLVDTEDVVYNWATIMEVKENQWMKP